MESSRKQDSAGLSRTQAAMSGPLTSDPVEKLRSQIHVQTDSFLVAARLIRRGCTEEGKKPRWQFSPRRPALPAPSTSASSQASGNPAESSLKSRASPVSTSRKTPEEEASEKRPEQEERVPDTGFSAADRHRRTQSGPVYVWASGCRSTFRQSRRFRAPILPVIAEM
ncbi:uncharacterized protein V6R79_021881 [Siganus canaliculatus]